MDKGRVEVIKKDVSLDLNDDKYRLFKDKYQEFINSKITKHKNLSIEQKYRIFGKMLLSCKRCHLYQECRHPLVPRYKVPDIMVIGRSGGSQENKTGEFQVDSYPSGHVFSQYLNQLGVSRSQVYITNVCMCCTKKNRPPEISSIKKCELWKSIEFSLIYIPQIILLLGNDSLRFIYGDNHASVLSDYGRVYESNFLGKKRLFVPLVHPGECLRNPQWRKSTGTILKYVRYIREVALGCM